MKNINENIYRIIAETLNVDIAMIEDTLSIGDIPQWDSVGNLAIITQIEQRLSVEIPMDVLFELTSVGRIVKEIERLSNA